MKRGIFMNGMYEEKRDLRNKFTNSHDKQYGWKVKQQHQWKKSPKERGKELRKYWRDES